MLQTGKLLAVIGTTGAPSQQIEYPRDVAVDSQGNIYVAEHRGPRVLEFSAAGKFLAAWSFPSDSPIVAADSQGNIYAVLPDNQYIFKLKANGKILALWKTSGRDNGLAVDAQNNIYVAAGDQRNIVKYSPNGKQLSLFAQATCHSG
jgi:DNA-binding beta-propeller fold protein YncE